MAAVRLLSSASIPTNLTVLCVNALLADVNCSPVVASLRNGYYYPASTLNRTCTADCDTALNAYETDVMSACDNQTWNGYQDTEMPLVIVPNLLRFQYNLTCLRDSGRWCNVVAAAAALAQDPGSSLSTGSALNTTTASNPCDLCFIKGLMLQAGSPYYDGPALASQSLYQSKTSSCQVSGYALTTSALGFYTPTARPTPTPSPCTGKTYNIQSFDSCYSISKSQGIGTAWLLTDNNLLAYCADFPRKGDMCLINTCRVYTIQPNDTCMSIVGMFNITAAQVKAWNPVINAGCYNLINMNGSSICISAPGKQYAAPSASALAPSLASIAALVPTDIAHGTNTDCGMYYQAVTGDYCNLITIKYGISLADFVFLNPAINQNCTNLYEGESYCVVPVGDINTYPNRPGYVTPAPKGTGPATPFTDLPTATYTTPTSTQTPLALANGTRDDCNNYFAGDIFQSDLNGSNWKGQCELAASIYGVDLNDFGRWNVGLGNITLASCSFQAGVQYCGKLYFGDPPAPLVYPGSDLPIRAGVSPNCTEYGDVPDDWQCSDVFFNYDLTIAQFYSYNPQVNSDCSGLWPGYQYCIRTPDYVYSMSTETTKTSPPSQTTLGGKLGTSPSLPAPVQSGQPANCNARYTAQAGDSCSSVETQFFITDTQFHAWNLAVSSDCSSGFWIGYAYCVGVPNTVALTRSPSSSPTPTSSGVPAPTPNQANNAVSNCNKYAAAQSGDYCSLFASHNNITLDHLYAWNSVLGNDGSGCNNLFWSRYYYCVGVSAG